MNLDKALNVLTYVFGMALNLALLALVGFAVYWATMWGFDFGSDFAGSMFAVVEDYDDYGNPIPREFHLYEDTHISEVSRMLEEQGFISNRWWFQLERFLVGSNPIYRAGTYTLTRNMSNTEINIALRQRPEERVGYHVVRIREGWSLRDMAAYFEYREFFYAEDFLHVAEHGHFAFPFLLALPPNAPNRLEGYLFPDTYHFPLSPNPGGVITQMLRRFDDIWEYGFAERAHEMGLTMHEVIIMASIIEAEVMLPSERPIVSQVIHRRIAQGMHLQMCSTVQFDLYARYGIRRDRLLNIDLALDSLYNTYMHQGLPIGPISAPGLASIEAVLWPADTDYLLFVLMDPSTGQHHFPRTYAEHSAADAYFRALHGH